MTTSTLPVEIAKPLAESLTADDLRMANELAQSIPSFQEWSASTAIISETQAQSAADGMKIATRIRTFLWERDTSDVQKAFELHRSLTAKRAAKVKFFDDVVALAKSLIGRRAIEQKRIADESRRAAEQAARDEAERQRQAEVTARLAEAAEFEAAGKVSLAAAVMEEAQDIEDAPVVPIYVPTVESPKIEGASISFKLVGTVREPARYVCYLLGIPFTPAIADRVNLLNEAISGWSASGINAQLKRGLPLGLHGVDVAEVPITRNSGRR